MSSQVWFVHDDQGRLDAWQKEASQMGVPAKRFLVSDPRGIKRVLCAAEKPNRNLDRLLVVSDNVFQGVAGQDGWRLCALISENLGSDAVEFRYAIVSGAPVELREPRAEGCVGTIHCPDEDDERTCIRRLLELWSSSEAGWDTVHTCSSLLTDRLECSLQALSALLPIGLLWEAHNGDKCKALATLKQASPIEFEQRVQRYACAVLAGDCAAAKTVWAEIVSQHARALEKLGGADDLNANLECLCKASTPKEWNCKLKTLRDELLAKADA